MNHMPPKWMMYPELPLGSLGWRMGYGEYYSEQYNIWKNGLSDSNVAEHDQLFPEPKCWSLDERNLLRHNSFWTYRWDESSRVSTSQMAPDNKRPFICFWGHHEDGAEIGKACLSQWYYSVFRVNTRKYHCMEQYMMAHKALLFEDKKAHEKIMESNDPKAIKELGRQVKHFDSATWEKFKMDIVLTGNYYKFVQNKNLRDYLIETGPSMLVEASPYDTIWGVGMSQDNPAIKSPSQWNGANLLGFALMQVREEVKRIWKNYGLIDWDDINKRFGD